MDTEGSKEESSSSEKNGGNICGDVKEVCEPMELGDNDSRVLVNKLKKPLVPNEPSSKVESQIIFDGDNTQVITEEEHIKEIVENHTVSQNDFEIMSSHLLKEGLEVSEHEKGTSGHKTNLEENNSVKNESPGKLDETMVIESDEDIREDKDDKEKITKENNEEICGEKSFGDESQTSTVDIVDLDKTPLSPEDIFTSQPENSLVDDEGFIPSSLPSQSEKCSTEEVVLSEHANVSTSQKRKMEEFDEIHNETKIPRLESFAEKNTVQIDRNVKECGKEKEDNTISEQADTARRITISETCSAPLVACDHVNNTDGSLKGVKENKSQDCIYLLESSKNTKISKDSCKSADIVFSSFGKCKTEDSSSEFTEDIFPHTLPTIQEENGEEWENGLDNLCLRISVSPSQHTQSFVEPEFPTNEVEAKTISSEKYVEDSSTPHYLSYSHHNSKCASAVNSHSSNGSQREILDTVTVQDDSDLQITSGEEKSTASDIVVSQIVENGSCAKSDVTVLLDEIGQKSNLYLGLAKHKDVNGTALKRTHPETVENAGKQVVMDLEEADRTSSDCDLHKSSHLLNMTSEGTSTPDLPHLPNKMNYHSTPNEVTPTFANGSTVEPASLSARKLRDYQDTLFPLRSIECGIALKCHLHVQVNEDLRQVHSIHILQCNDVEDLIYTGPVNPHESSSGSAADESKNCSPSSVTSVGPFSLKTHSCQLSSSSTSTTSSGHSTIGIKSKSADWQFTVPSKLPPIRSRTRNVQLYSEFSNDLFELLEKRLYVDEADTKLSSSKSLDLSASVAPDIVIDETKDMPQITSEISEHVLATPKNTKKLTRVVKGTRSAVRNIASKSTKEIKEEESSPLSTAEVKHTAGESTGSQKKSRRTPSRSRYSTGESTGSEKKLRKTPSRSSKRNTTSTTPIVTEEQKVSSSSTIGFSSGRSRRNRSEQNQSEKVESSSNESSHVYDWVPEGCFTKLVPEAPVFARWTDKKYYPGRVKEKMKDGRWVIEFDDKTVRPLKAEFIIAINILTKGQIVFAYDGEDYEQGIIVEFKLKEGEVQYGVDLDSGRKLFVPRARLFMSEDQARLLQENMDPKSSTTSSPALTTVSCDNIVHHKRPRATRVLFGNSSPSVSGVAKTAKRPSHDTSCSSSLSDSNDKGSTLVLDEVGGVDPEVPSSFPESLHTPSGRGKGPGRIKSKTRTHRRNTSANHTVTDMQESNTLLDVLGPIPEKGSNMFSGKSFLLTYTCGKLADSTMIATSKSSKKSDQTSGSEYEDVSADDELFSKIPFVKEHLKRQLEAGGGTVFESYEDVPEDQYQNCFLIADRPSLTAKYILCLASGIRIINHLWVIEEAKGSSRHWDSVWLQAGWDLEGHRWIPQEAVGRTRKQKPLNKKEVGIVNESQTFIKFWEKILELLGANVRHISPGSPEQDRQFSGLDVILTDSTCPPEVQDRAREWSIPLVSTVWVTQSLINWRIRPFSGHPHYRYDYCAPE